MKRKLFLLAVAFGMTAMSLWSPAPATALYPTCSNVYCSAYPGSRCTCPKWPSFWNYCSTHWQDGCPLIP